MENTDTNVGSNQETDFDKTNQLIVLLILTVLLIIFYIIFQFINVEEDDNTYYLFYAVKLFLWCIIILLVMINAITYFFDINILDELYNLLYDKPQPKSDTNNDIDISVNIPVNEVYHIPGSVFSYHDAKAVCKSMDAELATRKQLANSQKNGANWCSYGWSDDQLALYPTSQSAFDKLQKKKGHEYDCGIPGVNGGYVANPYLKFGANCYGIKPKQRDLDKEFIENRDEIPMTEREYIFNERVKYWKNRADNILVYPFNNNNWSKI